MLKTIFVSLILLSVAGCSDFSDESWIPVEIKQCTDSGGIPVRSIWDNRLVDCIYQPSP